ncbi:MAG: nucleotidyl transferase AbiEii/AbiGii toxin family protein [Dehalococcoidia bacterium]
MNEYLPDEIVVIHKALAGATIPHAFGGAIALAYWGTPRYTHDVDINIALQGEEHQRVLDALATVFPITDRQKAEREVTHIAQTRLRWGALPVDLFFANTPFHEAIATCTREVEYVDGTTIPVISAEDLILCKALFNRPKDWIDIENIVAVQAHLDVGHLYRWLQDFPDPEGERLPRIDRLLAERQRGGSERR